MFLGIHVLISIFLVGVSSQTVGAETDDSIGSDPVVLSRDGKIQGRRAKTVGQQKVYYAFQGIPYAEPPIGNLRFKPPEKKSKWTGILDTTQDKNECLQGLKPRQGSEDCLYINVYTPTLQRKKLAVMAWIYGGGFALGNSSYQLFGPDYLLEEDIVFVSFNYRVGIFGFGSTEDSACPGNFGLKDQILALRWVQENIAFFGGDPSRVTIFGQSAGAASVSYLLQSERAKNLFRGAIMNSGTSLCLWSLNRKSRKTMFSIGKLLNVDTSNSTSLIDGLRKIDAERLQNVAFLISVSVTLENPLEGLVFGPVKEAGVVDMYSEQALSMGRLIRTPVLMGFTSNESAVGEVEWYIILFRDYFQKYDLDASLLTPIDLTANKEKIVEAGKEIKSFYFGNSPIVEQQGAIMQFINDDMFIRPIRRTVINQSKYVPVYFYKFSYSGLLGNPSGTLNDGVGHAEELPYLFRKHQTRASRNDILTRSRMVKMWTNFVKFSKPIPTRDTLLDNVTWPPSRDIFGSQLYMDIDNKLKLQRNPSNVNMKFWDGIYTKYGDPPFDTY